MNLGEQSLCQWKPIPHRGAKNEECTGLPCESIRKRDKEYPRSIERRELRPVVPGVGQQQYITGLRQWVTCVWDNLRVLHGRIIVSSVTRTLKTLRN